MRKLFSQPGKRQGKTRRKKLAEREQAAPVIDSIAAESVQIPAKNQPVGPHQIINLQQILGNRAVQRMMANRTSPGGSPVVQRDEKEGEAAAPRNYQVGFGRIRYNLRTMRDAFDLSYDLADLLVQSMEDLDTTAPEYQEAQQWLVEIAEVQPYLMAHEEETIDEFSFTQINLWFEEFRRVERGVRNAQNRRIRADLSAAQTRAEASAGAIFDKRKQLNEALRAAYLSGDSDAIADMSSYIGNVLGIGLGLRDISRQISEGLSSLTGPTTPPPSRYIPILESANQVLTTVNLVYQLSDMEAPTELGTALNEVNGALGIFSAGGSLLGLSAHIGLITDLYLVPMVMAITSRLNALLDHFAHGLNLETQEIGMGVVMSNEPGGTAMYQYLTSVMRAGSAEEILWPPPEQVANYLVNNRENISAGARSELPTEQSWVFWHNLDVQRGREWVFAHRIDLWHMFYGSLGLPSAPR